MVANFDPDDQRLFKPSAHVKKADFDCLDIDKRLNDRNVQLRKDHCVTGSQTLGVHRVTCITSSPKERRTR